MICRFSSLVLAAFLSLSVFAQTQTTNKFEKDIIAFEAADKTNKPPANAVLFVGSSSIRLWKTLAKDFPDLKVINRGFGGSQIADANHFFERVVLPHKPKTIVMYSGGNDINAKKAPERVAEDFKIFAGKVRQTLPETRIAYIAIAPNPARWGQIEQVRAANKLIEEFTRSDERLSFIDTFTHMLGEDGLPKPDIFVDDKLHMNDNGYRIWTKVVGEHLRALGSARK